VGCLPAALFGALAEALGCLGALVGRYPSIELPKHQPDEADRATRRPFSYAAGPSAYEASPPSQTFEIAPENRRHPAHVASRTCKTEREMIMLGQASLALATAAVALAAMSANDVVSARNSRRVLAQIKIGVQQRTMAHGYVIVRPHSPEAE
jgi:hypothetical protein